MLSHDPQPRHLAICVRDPRNDLVSAECQQLLACKPDSSGRAFCRSLEHISNAAYIRYGARHIIQTETLDALTGWLRQVRFSATDFRLRVVVVSGHGAPAKQRLTVAVANAIHGGPDLDHPKRQFLLMVSRQTFWFGEIVVEAARSYRQHEAKPYHTAGSLPARLARGLVNLVGPSATSIVNPCCGTGSILLEACALGLKAYGTDRNPLMATMSRQNLAHFNYAARVDSIDAGDWTQTADALIADLPYGKARIVDEAIVARLIRSAASMAPVAVLVADRDISASLQRAGFRGIELYRVQKSRGFSRFVHRARSAALTAHSA